jgi:hypothetical protein
MNFLQWAAFCASLAALRFFFVWLNDIGKCASFISLLCLFCSYYDTLATNCGCESRGVFRFVLRGNRMQCGL